MQFMSAMQVWGSTATSQVATTQKEIAEQPIAVTAPGSPSAFAVAACTMLSCMQVQECKGVAEQPTVGIAPHSSC